MHPPDAEQVFAVLAERKPPAAYNFDRFRTEHLVADARRTLTDRGVRPGEAAPDFSLPRVGGGALRLSDLRGQLVLLHFGSYT